MRKNHSKIVCIKLVHLPYLYYISFIAWVLYMFRVACIDIKK